jgi:hypothetical protein
VTSSDTTAERPTSEPVPGGRGNRDEVGQVERDRPHLRMVPRILEDIARMPGHHQHRLRDVERGAAAEPDHRIGAMVAERSAARHRLRARRIAPDAVEHRDIESGRAQRGNEAARDRELCQRAIGDDQRPREAAFPEVRSHQRRRARAEVDGGGKTELVDGHGGSQMISK